MSQLQTIIYIYTLIYKQYTIENQITITENIVKIMKKQP